MIVGSVDVQVAMVQQQQQQQQQHCSLSLPWAAEHQQWQQREAHYREQLERHYFAQQEVEFNAQLSKYYAERRHQEEQQRLNQVLYDYQSHGHTWNHGEQQAQHAQHTQHAAQLRGPAQHADAQPDCSMAVSPRPPLAAVSNHLAPWGPAGGGMQWEAAAAAGRKRGHEAAALGGDSTACPDSAFKRRTFRRA